MIFGMEVGFGPSLLIFGKSRSKVKGQGHESEEICLFKLFLATEGQHGSDRDQVGSGRVLFIYFFFIIDTACK